MEWVQEGIKGEELEAASTDSSSEVFCSKDIDRNEAVAGGGTELGEVFP